MAWLAIFFLVPMVYLGKTSLEQGLFPIFTFKWAWGNFHDAISLYHTQFVRSFEYAGRVTLPLSLPGVFAGTLLTFIPATGDFINAYLLGTPKQYMIGNVIQSQFLNIRDYPTAAALSFVLMGLILVAILAYARILGTEKLTG